MVQKTNIDALHEEGKSQRVITERLWLFTECCIVGLQIVLRDQKSKEGFKYQSVGVINQKSPQYWVGLRQDALQRTNPGRHFRRTFIISVDVCCLLIGRQTRQRSSNQHSPPVSPLGPAKQHLTHIPPSCAKHQFSK